MYTSTKCSIFASLPPSEPSTKQSWWFCYLKFIAFLLLVYHCLFSLTTSLLQLICLMLIWRWQHAQCTYITEYYSEVIILPLISVFERSKVGGALSDAVFWLGHLVIIASKICHMLYEKSTTGCIWMLLESSTVSYSCYFFGLKAVRLSFY